MLKSIGSWIWRRISSKAGIASILGVTLSVVTFFVGRWWDRPKIHVDIVSLNLEVPDEVTVFVRSEKELHVLGPQIEFLLLQKKPEIYRIFKPDQSAIRAGEGILRAPVPLPLFFDQQSISELRQLHNLSVLLPDDVVRAEAKRHEEFLEDLRAKFQQEKTALGKLHENQNALEKWRKENPMAPPGFVPPGFTRPEEVAERELAFKTRE